MNHTTVVSIIKYVLLALALCSGLANAGKLYKWVDDQGNVQFTDSIPPSDIGRAHAILKQDGMVDKVVDRAKTPAEIRQDKERARLQAENKRLIAVQQAADKILLRTFRTEQDIMAALNNKLATVDLQIAGYQATVRRHQNNLSRLQEGEAATLEKSAKPISKNLENKIQETLKRINDTYGMIQQKKQIQAKIRSDFEVDMKRFRILKNLNKPEQAQKDEEEGTTFLDNLIPCGEEAMCDQAWLRAEAFVLKHATTPLQIQGDFIIMAKAPKTDDDISITLSRIRQPKQPVMLFLDLFCKNSTKGKALCAGPKVKAIYKAYHQEVGLMP